MVVGENVNKIMFTILSKEIPQYHQIISLIQLYCWFSAVIFKLEVVNHFWRGHR